MWATKIYYSVKCQENSISKWLNYPWSRVCKSLRKCDWHSIYPMNVRHHFGHLLIASPQILPIYHSSICKQSVLILKNMKIRKLRPQISLFVTGITVLRQLQQEETPLICLEDYETWFNKYINDIKKGPKGGVVP